MKSFVRCLILAGVGFAGIAAGATAIIRDPTHYSQVFDETRHYRIFLPPDYETSGKRYPVIYWFHGYSERYNQPVQGQEHRNYDVGTDYDGDTIGAFVATHDVIVVKWDGYNPRNPGENYPRPYNIGPVETYRQFPLYFPELMHYIDASYRTIPDREHRATSRALDGRLHVVLGRRQISGPGGERVELHGVVGVRGGTSRIPGGVSS